MAKGLQKKAERKRREATAGEVAIEGEEEKGPEPLRPKKRKKQKQEEAEPEDEAGEEEQEALAEAARRSARRKRKQEAQEAAEDATTAKPKKQRKQWKEAAEEEAVEDEDVAPESPKKPKKRKQQREKAAEDESKEATPKEGGEEVAAEAEEFTVFVGGVPWACDDATLRKDFEECGEVLDMNLLKHSDSGLSRGIAFVTFRDRAGMDAALEFDGTDYWGRQLQVYRAESRGGKGGKDGRGQAEKLEVFLKNLPAETDEAALLKVFRDCGQVLRVNVGQREDGRCKGFAWITFKTRAGLAKALAHNGEEHGGKTLVVEKSGLHLQAGGGGENGGRKGGGKKGKGNPEQEVFVRNLTYEATEADVRKHFEATCGAIERMHMPTAPGGNCMGFAFMTFETMEGFIKATEMNGEQYDGRRLEVQKSGHHKDDKGKGKSKGKGKGKGKK